MRTRSLFGIALMAFVILATVAHAVVAEDGPSAKVGFGRIVKAAKDKDAGELGVILPNALVGDRRDWDPEDLVAWREGFALELSEARVLEVSEGEGVAVVRFRRGARGAVKEVRLRYVEPRWVLDCPQSYLLSGRFLETANGRRSARCELSARMKNESYGESAFSFAHVTKDPKLCKNRMDLWFCKHGDLHMSAKDRIALAGKGEPLAKIEGLEAEWSWERSITPEKGSTYVVHCRRKDHRDFYVKMRVLTVGRTTLTFEWELLAAGPGAPTTIHSEQPLESRDGADGCDGLCGGPLMPR